MKASTITNLDITSAILNINNIKSAIKLLSETKKQAVIVKDSFFDEFTKWFETYASPVEVRTIKMQLLWLSIYKEKYIDFDKYFKNYDELIVVNSFEEIFTINKDKFQNWKYKDRNTKTIITNWL